MTNDTELRKLAEAATPGPWRLQVLGQHNADLIHKGTFMGVDGGSGCPEVLDEDDAEQWENNAKYLAAVSPDVLLALLDRLEAPADRVETEWQPIETAPKDGTAIDLWGVNRLHPERTGRRATNVTWGWLRDWMGTEREGWHHGCVEDFEPTHWKPLPSPPALLTERAQS